MFFQDVKSNKLEKVMNLIKDEPTLAYEFDKDN